MNEWMNGIPGACGVPTSSATSQQTLYTSPGQYSTKDWCTARLQWHVSEYDCAEAGMWRLSSDQKLLSYTESLLIVSNWYLCLRSSIYIKISFKRWINIYNTESALQIQEQSKSSCWKFLLKRVWLPWVWPGWQHYTIHQYCIISNLHPASQPIRSKNMHLSSILLDAEQLCFRKTSRTS